MNIPGTPDLIKSTLWSFGLSVVASALISGNPTMGFAVGGLAATSTLVSNLTKPLFANLHFWKHDGDEPFPLFLIRNIAILLLVGTVAARLMPAARIELIVPVVLTGVGFILKDGISLRNGNYAAIHIFA